MKLVLVVALALVGAQARATDLRACPAAHDGQPLATGQVLDGPLQDNAILVPDSGTSRHGVETGRWQVGYVYDAGRQVTLDCQYGAARVSAPVVVAARVEACTYAKSKQGVVVLGCR